MGIYYNTTTYNEDWDYMQKLIDSGEAQYKDNKIIHTYYDIDGDCISKILWENCHIDTKENFLGENPPKQTPWGIGKFTRDGCNYIYHQLMKQGRSSSTL